MPVEARALGSTTSRMRIVLDARWMMAFAAGLGHTEPHYLDVSRGEGIHAHPVFPVAPEWALRVDAERRTDLGTTADESARAVHAGHSIEFDRPIRSDEEVELTSTVTGVERTVAGARVTTEFRATDTDGSPIWTSILVSLYRHVDVIGETQVPPRRPEGVGDGPDLATEPLGARSTAVAANAAHIYTECARIWNPIHTDGRAALAAGLQAPILHGTATLSHGIDAVLDLVGASPKDVRRLRCAFRSMVIPPTILTTEMFASEVDDLGRRCATFRVRDRPSGRIVLNDAEVVLA